MFNFYKFQSWEQEINERGGNKGDVITQLIVTVTKFPTVIGSPGAFLSRNQRVITQVPSQRCNFFVFGYPRDFQVNYVRFDGFLRNVFYSFQNLGKVPSARWLLVCEDVLTRNKTKFYDNSMDAQAPHANYKENNSMKILLMMNFWGPLKKKSLPRVGLKNQPFG